MERDYQLWLLKMERRKVRRVRTNLKGKLFIPNEAREEACVVVALSERGASVHCKRPPSRRTNIVLYIDAFRLQGTTTQPTKEGTGVRFDCTTSKRHQIVEALLSSVSR
jgi:hypothetical protein